MPAKDFAGTRFSALADITPQKAPSLHPVWTFSTGVLGGHEGQPSVVGGVMYVVTPWPNVLYAFDLSKEGYPLKWKYRPDVSPNAIGVSCCDTVNRGAFYADGKLFYNLLDGHTVAVDAATGRELWNTRIADVGNGETVSMAPTSRQGPSHCRRVRGRIRHLRMDQGPGHKDRQGCLDRDEISVLTRTCSIRQDTFKPPYDPGVDSGARSWADDTWKTGGAPVWGGISYDPELDLIYYGTGNPSPYNPEQRVGDNKWTASVLARRPADGALVWAYQFTPHDNWDYDATGAMILADLTVGGKSIKALVHFDKNGFAYTLDRATGRLISAEAFSQRHVGQVR